MSLREVPSAGSLLARKGAALPANLHTAKSGAAEPSSRSLEGIGEIAPEMAKADPAADLKARAPAGPARESTPAASLLPFDLSRHKYRPDALPDLAEDEPDIVLDNFVPADLAAGDRADTPQLDYPQQAELALHADPAPEAPEPETRTTFRPDLRIEPRVDLPRPARAPAPTPDPDWRLGVAAAAPAKRASGGGWLLPLGALAAAFAALIVGWNMATPTFDLGSRPVPGAPGSPAPAAASGTTSGTTGETAEPVAVEPPPPVTAQLPQPTLSPAPDSAVNAGAGADQPAAADAPAPAAPTLPLPKPSELAPDAPAAVKPTVDLVRLEANGEAVIAGRAAPNSELIILDNGEPIGTVRADAFGEWVFVPETAVPAGDHEFGLVLKTVQESVSMPAPSKPALPPAPAVAPIAGDAGSAPIPVRKPAVEDTDAVPGAIPADDHTATQQGAADFVIQLASVKTRAGAELEWRKLQQRFPDILAAMVLALDEVKLANYGTVVRIRTGAFNSQWEAASLCARLASQNQECLVVRVSMGN